MQAILPIFPSLSIAEGLTMGTIFCVVLGPTKKTEYKQILSVKDNIADSYVKIIIG